MFCGSSFDVVVTISGRVLARASAVSLSSSAAFASAAALDLAVPSCILINSYARAHVPVSAPVHDANSRLYLCVRNAFVSNAAFSLGRMTPGVQQRQQLTAACDGVMFTFPARINFLNARASLHKETNSSCGKGRTCQSNQALTSCHQADGSNTRSSFGHCCCPELAPATFAVSVDHHSRACAIAVDCHTRSTI